MFSIRAWSEYKQPGRGFRGAKIWLSYRLYDFSGCHQQKGFGCSSSSQYLSSRRH